MVGEGKRDRGEIGEEHACEGAEEQRGGVAELRECSAGDHVADLGEAAVSTQADTGAGQAYPDFPAAALHGPSQGAIVDYFVAHCREAAEVLQGFAAKQDATPCGSGGARLWIGGPTRRIQFQEEK